MSLDGLRLSLSGLTEGALAEAGFFVVPMLLIATDIVRVHKKRKQIVEGGSTEIWVPIFKLEP